MRTASQNIPQSNRTSRGSLWIYSAAVVVVLLLLGLLLHLRASRKIPLNGTTIAVIPFSQAEGQETDSYFIDGVTEDVLNQLSKISDLQIISHSTMMGYIGSKKSLSDIGSELHAGSILRGEIARGDKSIRISVQLMDAAADVELWHESFNIATSELLRVESEIPLKIADVLGVRVSEGERESIEKQSTMSSAAHDLYVRGREYYYLYTKEDNENAIRMFAGALEKDQHYALAYAGLGDAYCQRFSDHGYGPEWLDSASSMCYKAIALDSNLSEAHKALGSVYYDRGWYGKALAENARAVQLNPGFSDAVNNFGVLLNMKGDYEEGLRWVKKAMILDPTQARSYVTCGEVYMDLTLDSLARVYYSKAFQLEHDNLLAHTDLVWLNLDEGKPQEALGESWKALAISPNDISALEVAGFAEFFSHRFDSAMTYFRRIPAIYLHSEGVAATVYVLNMKGRHNEALEYCKKAKEFWEKEIEGGSELSIIRYDLAALAAIFNDKADAYRRLQEAMDLGWLDYRWPQLDPVFAALRHEEQFKKLMDQMQAVLEGQKARVLATETPVEKPS